MMSSFYRNFLYLAFIYNIINLELHHFLNHSCCVDKVFFFFFLLSFSLVAHSRRSMPMMLFKIHQIECDLYFQGKIVSFCNFHPDDLMRGEWWTPKGPLEDKLLFQLRQWEHCTAALLIGSDRF